MKRFLLVYIPAGSALAITILTSIWLDTGLRFEKINLRESARIEVAQHQLAEDVAVVTAELRILANLPSLQHYLDSGNPNWRDDMTKVFLAVSRATGLYDQIRFLDETGHEVVRVNFNSGKPGIVPREQLQDKSGRYFFRDTFALGREEVYVSPLDLNIEHDQLEIPHKPMIRFGTPVFDSAGRKRGIILLNYFGIHALTNFRNVMRNSDAESMLLNRDGYWLASPNPDDEWGFMLNKKDRTFGQRFAQEWATISSNAQGTLQTPNGLFVYATAQPLLSGQKSSTGSQLPRAPSRQTLQDQDYQWKIVSRIPNTTLWKTAYYRQPGGIVLIGLMYLLLAIAAWIIATVTLGRKRALVALRQSETHMREIANTMSDGLLVTDARGRITFSNPAASRLLGYSYQELQGADMHELIHVRLDGAPYPKAECPVLKVLHSGQANRSDDEVVRRKDASILPVSVSAAPIWRENAVTGLVIALQDISPQKQLEAELRRQAHTDVLTGLHNRRHFIQLAEQELARVKRLGQPFALMMMDVDYFKSINDSHGHDAGDIALRHIGEICMQSIREIDIAGRLGGEEFAILLPETGIAQAMEAAERLRQAIADSQLLLLSVDSITLTVSIGVAIANMDDESIDLPLKRADQALYKAKEAGRNRVASAPLNDKQPS